MSSNRIGASIMSSLREQWKARKAEWIQHKGMFVTLRSDNKYFVGDTMEQSLDLSEADGLHLPGYCAGIKVSTHLSGFTV